jgi:hypothetical protein
MLIGLFCSLIGLLWGEGLRYFWTGLGCISCVCIRSLLTLVLTSVGRRPEIFVDRFRLQHCQVPVGLFCFFMGLF